MGNTNSIENYIISKDKLLQLLNPHLQNFHSFEKEEYEVNVYNAKQLFFNVDRFDLVAKYIYIEFFQNKYKTEWHKEVYTEHIRAFSNNTFKEGDGRKDSIDDYYNEFNLLIKSIKEIGFDKTKSILPVSNNLKVIDGAHRLAVSFYFKQKISTIKLESSPSYNYTFFKEKGLPQSIADFIAFKYCELNSNARIVNLFPISTLKEDKIENVLKKYGHIYYKKNIYLTEEGQNYIVKEMYLTEHWIGADSNNFAGAKNRARISFNSKNNIKVYVFIPHGNKSSVQAKTEIRELINKGNYPIHINDTHKETIRLAQTYFNENSIHFINYRQDKKFIKFEELFTKYKKWIKKSNLNRNDFCIDASSILSVYGLREGADLDFLYSKQQDIDTGIDLVDCHNVHSHYYNSSIDDIIYNPKNHFYFEGHKFISINLLRSMKLNRYEEKDIADVMLIDSINISKFNHVLKIKFYKFRKNIKKIHPANIYKTVRTKAHRIIPINSILWNITKKIFYIFKKIKNN